jgi:hypothetical protein
VAEQSENRPVDEPAEEPPPLVGEIAVPGSVPGSVPGAVPARRWSREVAAVRGRLLELARDPAVVATATVGAALAVRQALKPGALLRSAGNAIPRDRGAVPIAVPISVSISVVHHVHVVHHVVHYVGRPPLPPGRTPPL